MFQIICYVSTADPSLTNSEMQNLLNFVQLTNNKKKINGVLMHADGNFFQIIEGENKLVQNLFQKVKTDSRHYDIIKIFDREISNSSFTKYQTSFKVIGDKYEHTELQQFLKEEKQRNPDQFDYINYLTNKFLKLS